MSKEAIKEDIQSYLSHPSVKALSANFFEKKYPEVNVQSIFDEMVADGEVGLRVTYECTNCLQKEPRMYNMEILDETLIYFMCLQCGSEYEGDECIDVDEVIYYCKPKEEE